MQFRKLFLSLGVVAIFFGCAQTPKTVISPNKIELSSAISRSVDAESGGAAPTAEYYFGLGEYAYYEKRYKDAYEYYLNASFFDGENQLINEKLTLVIYRIIYSDREYLQNWNRLRSSYFLDLDKNSSLDFLSGIFNFLDGNYRTASHYLIKEVENNKNRSKPFLSFLLFTLHKAGLYEQELAVAQLANQEYPDDAKFANWYAYSIVMNQKREFYPFAESLLKKSLAKEPKNVYYWDSMMWLYYKWDKQQKAFEIAKKSLADDSKLDDPEILLHLGYVYQKQGLPQQAKNYFEMVVSKDKGALAQEAAGAIENFANRR